MTEAAFGPTWFMRMYPNPCRSRLAGDGGLMADHFLSGVHIHSCGNGHLWFRPYGESLLANAPKGTKRSRPGVRPLAKARRSLAPVLLRGPAAIGHPWPCAANPASMPGCPLRRTSTRPPEGAGRSKSKAQGELTLGLMSGEGRVRCFALRRSDACSRRRLGSRPFTHECSHPL